VRENRERVEEKQMARPLQINIAENTEQLVQRIRHEQDVLNYTKLQMLLLLKKKNAKNRQELCQQLNKSEATIGRWLKQYREGGLETLLEKKKAPGKPRAIPPDIMTLLKERLSQGQGFQSYQAITEWLKEQDVQVAYKTVHRIVRYELQAKLKVPRPRHYKQNPEAIETFKKT
jgi:transposase